MRVTIYAISILLFIPLNGDADIWRLLYEMQGFKCRAVVVRGYWHYTAVYITINRVRKPILIKFNEIPLMWPYNR
jgi:hypothetical protein